MLKEFDQKIEVFGKWDSIEVKTFVSDDSRKSRLLDRLKSTPGVGQICLVQKHKLPSMDHMLELTRNVYSGSLKEKRLAVR